MASHKFLNSVQVLGQRTAHQRRKGKKETLPLRFHKVTFCYSINESSIRERGKTVEMMCAWRSWRMEMVIS